MGTPPGREAKRKAREVSRLSTPSTTIVILLVNPTPWTLQSRWVVRSAGCTPGDHNSTCADSRSPHAHRHAPNHETTQHGMKEYTDPAEACATIVQKSAHHSPSTPENMKRYPPQEVREGCVQLACTTEPVEQSVAEPRSLEAVSSWSLVALPRQPHTLPSGPHPPSKLPSPLQVAPQATAPPRRVHHVPTLRISLHHSLSGAPLARQCGECAFFAE